MKKLLFLYAFFLFICLFSSMVLASGLRPERIEKRLSYRAVWTDVDADYRESSFFRSYQGKISAKTFGHEAEVDLRFRWQKPAIELEPYVRGRWSNGYVRLRNRYHHFLLCFEDYLYGSYQNTAKSTEFMSFHFMTGLILSRPFQVKEVEFSPLTGLGYWYQKTALDSRLSVPQSKKVLGKTYIYEAWSFIYGLKLKWKRLELEFRRQASFNEDLEKEATKYRSGFDVDVTELRGLLKLSKKLSLDIIGRWSDLDINTKVAQTHVKEDKDSKTLLIGFTYRF